MSKVYVGYSNIIIKEYSLGNGFTHIIIHHFRQILGTYKIWKSNLNYQSHLNQLSS